MTHKQRGRGGRPAFTLIEMLVVITIIAILVSLTAAAVMRAMIKGPELQTNSEINEFATKLSAIPNVDNYLPSRLHLSKLNNYPQRTTAGSLDADSVAFLQRRFGRQACFNFQTPPTGQFIDWNGDGNPNEELFLEGEQCLVFHLGGVPRIDPSGAITMTGFSYNVQNPAQAQAQAREKRQGPYFQFQTARLKPIASSIPGNTAGATFPVYLDPWKTKRPQPFAFFSSYGAAVGGDYLKYGSSDCPSLVTSPPTAMAPQPILPYIQSTAAGVTNFANATSFQIISAGHDGKWGPGGTNWNPAIGTTDPNGKDDQSNFSPHVLGAAAN